jgi:hypothetical protein
MTDSRHSPERSSRVAPARVLRRRDSQAFALQRAGVLTLALLAFAVGVVAWPGLAAAACPASAPGPEAQRKFHPGHYVTIGRYELRSGVNVNAVLGEGVTGVQLRYRWGDLERERDRYDFGAIRRDLAMAAKNGLQLVAVIEDKSFNGEMPTPSYLQDRYTLRGAKGYTAMRWDPFVVERMGKLVAALGAEFDCEPNFEGIAFQETALSLDDSVLHAAGYSAEKYRDALERQLREATTSLPRSRVFWYMNFLPGEQQYIGEIAERVAGTGVVMGGPDILPDNPALQRRTYPLYQRFSPRMKLFGSMQHDSYRHPRKEAPGGDFWSMEDLFVFARDKLHVDYVFWEYRARRQPANSRDWTEAREVIARHPSFRRAG